jgi:hypothetical protein
MNLSADTLSILKNFSEINDNILFKPGSKLNTISANKTILAEASITEKFDTEFGIHNLSELLRAIELFEKPNLKINGVNYMAISDEKSKQVIKYIFADKSTITTPQKTITMPDKMVTFTFKREAFDKVQKAATALNLPDIAVRGNGKNLFLVATDKKNKSSNDFSLSIGETDKTFLAYFKSDHFKIIPDDYDVAISKQKVSHFINRNKPIQYWIALEPDSEF